MDGRDTVNVSLLTAIGHPDQQAGEAKAYTIEGRINRRQPFRQEFNLTSGERSSLKLLKDNVEATLREVNIKKRRNFQLERMDRKLVKG
ncbi:hypothetical protein [Pedobacter gandavensis]|uniref:hypothetical protein n=1 Tax=Pedobacter gandavensis TaxID=2679963 RepID=UPI00292CCFDD|nr:hypothetical protein [Pedobacter gandavensis]